jgi:hypothetical protein
MTEKENRASQRKDKETMGLNRDTNRKNHVELSLQSYQRIKEDPSKNPENFYRIIFAQK